jgi:hypothetical protein
MDVFDREPEEHILIRVTRLGRNVARTEEVFTGPGGREALLVTKLILSPEDPPNVFPPVTDSNSAVRSSDFVDLIEARRR